MWCEEEGREDLLEEWDDPSKGPEEVTPASNEKVQWKCGKVECGWTWDALVSAGPDTSPLSQLNLGSCVPVTTQLIPLIHSDMLKLS